MLQYINQLFQRGIRYLFGEDTFKIIRGGEDFIFGELTRRAMDSPNGVAHAFIGFNFLPRWLPSFMRLNFYVFTRKKYLKFIANWSHSDARAPLDDLKKLLGNDNGFMINHTGSIVSEERRDIKKFLGTREALKISAKIFKETFDKWQGCLNVNDEIAFACLRIVIFQFINIDIKDLPREEIIAVFYEGDHSTFKKSSSREFKEAAINLKSLNDKVTEQYYEEMIDLEKPNYLQTFFERNFKTTKPSLEQVKNLNIITGALLVVGNLWDLLARSFLLLANNPEILEKLKTKLKDYPPLAEFTDNHWEEIVNKKSHPYLHSLYQEALRRFAVAAPVPRYASEETVIEGIEILPHSYLFVSLRGMLLHDQWGDPEIFNSDRDFNAHKELFAPFSTGARECPANTKDFVKAVFSVMLVMFREYEIILKEGTVLEVIPVLGMHLRLTQRYDATCNRSETPKSESIVPVEPEEALDKFKMGRVYTQTSLNLG